MTAGCTPCTEKNKPYDVSINMENSSQPQSAVSRPIGINIYKKYWNKQLKRDLDLIGFSQIDCQILAMQDEKERRFAVTAP